MSTRPPSFRPSRVKSILLATIGLWIVLRVLVIRSFREKNPAVIGRVKAFNRRWFNPLMLYRAGHRGWYAARLEHRGRATGALYATPVLAEPVREGFLIPMPYGRDVDWARNLLRSGEGVLERRDIHYRVGNPRIITFAMAEAELPGLVRTVARLYGIADFLRVDVLPGLTAEIPPPTS